MPEKTETTKSTGTAAGASNGLYQTEREGRPDIRTKDNISRQALDPAEPVEGEESTFVKLKREAARRGTEAAERNKERACAEIDTVADAVRSTAQHLRDQDQEVIANYGDIAAERIARFSSTLRDREVEELVEDARDTARRHPALFLGAAVAAGFMAMRFLTSRQPAYEIETDTGSGASR